MSAPLRVLIVEDLESDAALVIRQLRKAGGDVEALRVETAVEMRAALEAQAWDVVIADYRLPRFDAPGALAVLQQTGLDLPFIVVSGTVGEDLAVAMMRAGAHDYLMKDKLARLVPAVEREIGEARTRRERQQVEEALSAEMLRRRVLMDASRDGIAIIDQDHKVVEANPRFAEMLGYTPEEVKTLHTWDWEATMCEAQVRAAFADLPKTDAVFETRHRRKDGTIYDAEVSASGARVGGAAVVFTVSRDISARKRAETALRESEAWLRMSQEAAQAGSWSWDIQTNEHVWSDSLWRLYGLEPHSCEPSYEMWRDVIHPDDRTATEQAVQDAVRRRAEIKAEWRVRGPDDEERWLMSRGRPQLDEQGEVVRYLGIVVDVTERRWAEQVLRDSERTHRELVENLNDVVFTMNVAGRFDYVSPAAERVLGRPAAEIAGHHYSAFIHTDDRNAAALAFREAFDGRVYPCEFRFEGADGEYRWVQASTRPLVVEGQVDGLSGTLTDITERRQAEDALRTSESFLSSVIDQSPHPMWVSDDKGVLLRLNQACRDLLHVTDEEVVGKYNVLKDSVVEHSGAMPLVRRVYEAGETARFELDYDSSQVEGLSLAHSAHVVLAVTIFPIRDGAGKITNAVIQHTDISERRKAEEGLKEALAFNQMIVDSSPVGILIFKDSGQCIMANGAVAAIAGAAVERLLEVNFRTLESYRVSGVLAAAEEALSTGLLVRREVRGVNSFGNDVWYEGLLSPFHLHGERHLLFLVYDLRDRKLAEDALRKSETQLSAAVKLAHLGYWEYDVVGDLFTFNDHFYALLRTTAQREGGYTMSAEQYAHRFCHPDDLAIVARETQKAVETAEPNYTTELEYRVIFGDGQIGHMAVRIFIVKDAENRTVRTYGVNQDVTQRVRGVEALRASEERFRAVFDAVTDGVLVADAASGQFVMVNHGMCQMLGYTEQELLRLAVDDIHPASDLPMVKEVFRRQLAGEQPLAAGIQVRRKDARTFSADIHAVPLTLGGRPCLLGVFRDMTAFNEMEQQLRQAQKMEAIGQLAGGVAHDFNNILCVIQGHAELMLRGLRADDPLFRSATQIQSSGERAAALTRQLLAFSRKQALQPVVIDLNATVRNLESMLRRLIGEDVDFATTLDAGLGRVKADPGQIEQVIVNLAVNARDAMPQGGRLLVETANVQVDGENAGEHAHVAPGAYAMLAITDTGTGMDQRTQERLFEPFFTTKEIGKGTGLGLSTVYGIVKQSGGHIWVKSELGRGSTFRIYLPRTEEAVVAGATRSEGGPLRGAGERILVVEDEAELREIVREVLDDLGYRTTAAANGGEALLAVEEGGLELELLISDVVMPGMSGPLLAERLRRTRPELKVLFMSGYTDAAVARRGLLEAGTPFLQKPFKTEDLAAKVWWSLRGDKPDR